jgi:hypothetical protein
VAIDALRLAFTVAIGAGWSSAAQPVELSPDTTIQLQRTSCLGPCPVYSVAIDASGAVTYDGEQSVRVVGHQTARVSRSAVAALLATAERVHFFELRDAYRSIENPDGSVTVVSDMPTKIVTITVNGRTKRVEDYVGAPDELADLERAIDEIAGTKRWIFVDDATVDELVASDWSASGVEGARLLQEAIRRDDVPIAQKLIELGGRLDGMPTHRPPPLMVARSRAMVDLLVSAGADPNERPIGGVGAPTPLMSTAYKDAAIAEALLAAGARLEDLDDGRSALWYAACAGNWRVVAVLLRAGANARGAAGMTALECTRRARQARLGRRQTVLDRGQPTIQDFDEVIGLLENADKRRNH